MITTGINVTPYLIKSRLDIPYGFAFHPSLGKKSMTSIRTTDPRRLINGWYYFPPCNISTTGGTYQVPPIRRRRSIIGKMQDRILEVVIAFLGPLQE